MSSVAIVSDTHDQIANLRAVVAFCNSRHIEFLIHCGDLISPFMLDELDRFTGQIHLVDGNNLGDQNLIARRCARSAHHLRHHGESGGLHIDGLSFGVVHYPDKALALAASGQYDIICYGHDHSRHAEQHGRTLMINPGHLLGKDGPGSFVVFDCQDRSLKTYQAGADMNACQVDITEV